MKKDHDFVLYYSDLWLEEWLQQKNKFTKPTRSPNDNIYVTNKTKIL